MEFTVIVVFQCLQIHEDRRVEFQRQFADLFLVYTNDLKTNDPIKDVFMPKKAKKNKGAGAKRKSGKGSS